MLEPPGLYRTDGNPPEGVTMSPWETSKELVWADTIVDDPALKILWETTKELVGAETVVFAPALLNQCSLCNPGTTAIEAKEGKI